MQVGAVRVHGVNNGSDVFLILPGVGEALIPGEEPHDELGAAGGAADAGGARVHVDVHVGALLLQGPPLPVYPALWPARRSKREKHMYRSGIGQNR